MFGDIIQGRMSCLGLTHARVAERMTEAGVKTARQQVGGWVNGRGITARSLVALLDALSIRGAARLVALEAAGHRACCKHPMPIRRDGYTACGSCMTVLSRDGGE